MTSICEKKKFGKSTAYSCWTNAFIEFYNFMKNELTQLKITQFKQSIFNQWESMEIMLWTDIKFL